MSLPDKRVLLVGLFLFAAASGLALERARAGDRELEIVVVMANPTEDPDAGRCFRQIRSRIDAGYTDVTMLSSRRLLRLVGEESIEGFMRWEAEKFAPILRNTGNRDLLSDSIAIVDCRPGARYVDALVVHPSGAPIPRLGGFEDSAIQLRMRRMAIDRGQTRRLGDLLLRYAWIGFVP